MVQKIYLYEERYENSNSVLNRNNHSNRHFYVLVVMEGISLRYHTANIGGTHEQKDT